MQEFYRLIKGELLKQKRSFLWPVVIFTPLVGTLLTFANFCLRYDYLRGLAAKQNLSSWQLLLTQHHFLWAFFLPLVATIVASHVHYLEYKSSGWKQILALPVSRIKVYVAKWVLVFLLNLFMIIENSICLFLVGKVLGFPEIFDLSLFLTYTGYQIVAVSGLIGSQCFLSANLSNASVAMTIGFVGVASSLFFAQSEQLAKFIPYAHMIFTLPDPTINNAIALNYGFSCGLIFLGLGMIFFQRKEIS
ncbi:MAG: ABC transporter permease subunit [Firmicutes bacterium]|nr:ABC transporter permease subunit [Bacillota bacterium]